MAKNGQKKEAAAAIAYTGGFAKVKIAGNWPECPIYAPVPFKLPPLSYPSGADLGDPELDGNGCASVTCSSFSVGNHVITVTYSGDDTYDGSSATIDQEVDGSTMQGTSTVAATSSPNPSTVGGLVTFTATVAGSGGSGATPTGDVDFLDTTTGADLGDPTLSGGKASFSTSELGLGDHQISVTYSGDTNYSGSSTTLDQTVKLAATTTVVSTDPSPSNYGDSVTFGAGFRGHEPLLEF